MEQKDQEELTPEEEKELQFRTYKHTLEKPNEQKLIEKIAKALFKQDLKDREATFEQTSAYYTFLAEVILPIIEAEKEIATKTERERILQKIWQTGEGVNIEAVHEEVNTWCCEIEFKGGINNGE